MKRGTPIHPKMQILEEELQVERPTAVGIMELLWQFTAQFAKAGNIGKWSNAHIAQSIYWRGDPDKLIAALVKSHWIDKNDKHRLIIHDWYEHCEDAVHMALSRATELFADGKIPKMNRLQKPERDICEARFNALVSAQRAHSERTVSAQNDIPCAVRTPESAHTQAHNDERTAFALALPKPLPQPFFPPTPQKGDNEKKNLNSENKMGTIGAYLRMEITSLIRENLETNPVGSISMDLENRLRNDIEFAGKNDFAKGKAWFERWIVERYCPFILQMRDKRNQEGKPPGYYPSFAGMVEQFEKDMADKVLNTKRIERKKDNQAGSVSLQAKSLIKKCIGKELPETLAERRFCNDILESFGLLSPGKIQQLLVERAISPNEPNRSKLLWRDYLEQEPQFSPFTDKEDCFEPL